MANFRQAMPPAQLDPEQDARPFLNQYLQYIILWARYTGNTVDSHSLDGVTRDAINSEITNFLDHELPGLRVPYTQLEPGSDAPMKVFLVQKKTDFVLWGLRQVITSLQYDDKYAAHFSELAVSTTDRMAALAQNARHPFSLRHHMISSLSGSLLVLCSLLVRELTYDRQAEVEAFRNAITMLKDLAHSQVYAKRVLGDFEAIIQVVEGAIDGKDVPEDVAELFPYKSPSPLIRLSKVTKDPRTTNAGNGSSSRESGCGVQWL
jgi:hypothetical protein